MSMAKCNRERMSGLVLMEVVVSMMVLSVGILAASKSFSIALLARGLAQDYTDARFLASQKLSTTVAKADLLHPGSTQGRFPGEWKRFTWKQEVSQSEFKYNRIITMNSLNPLETMQLMAQPTFFGKVVVTVSWTRRGTEYKRTVATLVTPLGEQEIKGLIQQ